MDIAHGSIQRRENALTVVRGCIGTLLMQWDRLDEPMKKTLLETALDKTVTLVRNLEDDLRPLRISDLQVGTGHRPTPATG